MTLYKKPTPLQMRVFAGEVHAHICDMIAREGETHENIIIIALVGSDEDHACVNAANGVFSIDSYVNAYSHITKLYIDKVVHQLTSKRVPLAKARDQAKLALLRACLDATPGEGLISRKDLVAPVSGDVIQ